MPSITISDEVSVDPGFELRGDSPLASAGLKQLQHATRDFLASLGQGIDKVQVKRLALAATFSSPNLLSPGLPSLLVDAGVNCGLSVEHPEDGPLFDDDQFSPKIVIGPDDAWVAVEIDSSVTLAGAASVGALGVTLTGATAAVLTTYTHFKRTAAGFPDLRTAAATAFNNFDLLVDSASVRNQPASTVRVSDVSGSVTLAVAAKLPFSMDALATAGLPLNMDVSLDPEVKLSAAASVKVQGQLVVRCYRLDADTCQFGVYRKRGATLSVTLTACAGAGLDVNGSDILGPLLNKVLPGVDAAAAGIQGERAAQLNAVLGTAIDRSLSVAANAAFASSKIEEAAVLYTIRLHDGDAANTDAALEAAMAGDWTRLTELPNAECLRNVVAKSLSEKASFKVNLLGFYSADSVTSFLQKCTFLVDEQGQLTITDQLTASGLRVVATPYEADRDRLRKAMMENFLATAVYKVIGSKLNMNIHLAQTYFDYQRSADVPHMHANLLLAYSLGVVPPGSLDAMLQNPQWLDHVSFTATVTYSNADLLRVFFSDPAQRTPWSADALTEVARRTMAALIAPETDWDRARLLALVNDAYWHELGELPAGNYGASSVLPPAIKQASVVVHTDWYVIRTWVDAIVALGPVLAQALAAVEASTGDPRRDDAFMRARQALATRLGVVARRGREAFEPGWAESVMFSLGGQHGSVEVDIEAGAMTRHFERAARA